MDLCTHSRKFCPGLSRHSRIPAVESALDCRLPSRRLTTTSPVERTPSNKLDTPPMLKKRLKQKRALCGVDKENLTTVNLCPEQRLTSVGLTARLALLPCVAARSNSSSRQLLEKNRETCTGGIDGFQTSLRVIDAVKTSPLGNPEVSSGSTSVWSFDHHDLSEIQDLRETQSFEQDITSSVDSSPPSSPLRSSSPLCRERCPGAPMGRTSTQWTSMLSSMAQIKNPSAERSLKDLSSITQSSKTSLHEQISGSSLAGAFCSTFSYPLHSTINEHCTSLSRISASNSDLQYWSEKDMSSNSDLVADETLVKSCWRLLGEEQPNSAGSDKELANIYLSSTSETVVKDTIDSYIPLYHPSQSLSSPCKISSSRMFASRYDEGARSSINNLCSSAFAKNTAVFNKISSPSPTSNSPRPRLHRRLKRQIGHARLDELLYHQTIPRSQSTIDNDKNKGLSLLARTRCSAEHNTEQYSRANRTRKRFRHREAADNVESVCCCRECWETARHRRQAVEVCNTSRTGRYSTHQQIQHLQKKKVLMRKLRHFRRALYGDADSNCQFKTFAQI